MRKQYFSDSELEESARQTDFDAAVTNCDQRELVPDYGSRA